MIRTGPDRLLRYIGAYVALSILAGCSHAPDLNMFPQEGQAAVDRITAARLSGYIETLSGDEYEGRGPATAGDLRTQKYLATQL